MGRAWGRGVIGGSGGTEKSGGGPAIKRILAGGGSARRTAERAQPQLSASSGSIISKMPPWRREWAHLPAPTAGVRGQDLRSALCGGRDQLQHVPQRYDAQY